jgi:hypothetical protein
VANRTPVSASADAGRRQYLQSLLHQRAGPIVGWEEVAEGCGPVGAEDDLGVEVGRVDLANELAAAAAGCNNVQAVVASPDRNDLGDLVLAGSHHGGDCGVLRAEATATRRVDADAHMNTPGTGDERRRHITEPPITYLMRMQYSGRGLDQFSVARHVKKLATLPGASPRDYAGRKQKSRRDPVSIYRFWAGPGHAVMRTVAADRGLRRLRSAIRR